MYNLVFRSVFYKVTAISPLMFEVVLIMHYIQMRGRLIIHVVQIVGTQMITSRIYGFYRVN